MKFLVALTVSAIIICVIFFSLEKTTPTPEYPNAKEYRVRIIFCDTTKKDSILIVNSLDGHVLTSGDISTFNQPIPVFRGNNFVILNVCDIQTIGVKNDPKKTDGGELLFKNADSIIVRQF